MRHMTIIALILATALAYAKDGRSFYTEEKLQAALDKIERHDWARDEMQAAMNACAWAIENFSTSPVGRPAPARPRPMRAAV